MICNSVDSGSDKLKQSSKDWERLTLVSNVERDGVENSLVLVALRYETDLSKLNDIVKSRDLQLMER